MFFYVDFSHFDLFFKKNRISVDYIRVAPVTTCLAGNVCFGCIFLAVFNVLCRAMPCVVVATLIKYRGRPSWDRAEENISWYFQVLFVGVYPPPPQKKKTGMSPRGKISSK